MIKAKKSLGQNFLKSSSILDRIISAANIEKNDIILEIGPGKGSLTKKLLEKSNKVIAIEKDDRLIEFLQKKFIDEIKNNKLTLIHDDILTINPKSLLLGGATPKLLSLFRNQVSKYKIVANIPYYITGKIIRKFLSSNFQPSQMILMIQKEVAQRITSPHLGVEPPSEKKGGKESILSLSVKVYGEPKYIKTVSAKYFSPKPKVDSAILLINNISKEFFKDINEEKFFDLIHQAFSSKRKTLVNNLVQNNNSAGAKYPQSLKEEIIEILEKLNISSKIRAEDLSLQNWKDLYLKLEEI